MALFGLLLLAFTFSYEDFERRLQNYLEDAWIKLDDRNRAASGRHARAVGGFAAGTLRLLDRLFGPMTVSWQSVAVSALLALAANYLSYTLGDRRGMVWQALALMALAGGPLISPRLAFISVGALIALLGTVVASAAVSHTRLGDNPQWLLLWFGSLPVSCASGLLVLRLERRVFKWLSVTPSLPRALATILACAGAICVVIVVPIFLGDLTRPAHPTHRVGGAGLSMQMAQPEPMTALYDVAAMNVFTITPLLLVVVVAATFAIHRAFWEIAVRPLYALQRAGYRNAARSIGVACVLYGLRIVDSILAALFAR